MSTPWSRPSIPTVDVQEAAQRQAEDALLVDVREMDEYLELRAVDSVFVPLSEFSTRFSELPQDRPLLMVCRSGARSGRATQFLLAQGFSDVSNVSGGMIAWKNAALPTRSGPLDVGEGDL